MPAFEAVLGRPFGAAGTLAACATLTGALQAVDVPRTGYCGLMLPPLEDHGLAAAVAEGRVSVQVREAVLRALSFHC